MLSKISLVVLLLVIVSMMSAEELSLEDQWSKFKVSHNKNYGADEEPKRKEIFKHNLQKINEHNKKYEAGEVTFLMGVNQFTDLTEEEFKNTYTGGFRPPKSSGATVH